MDLKNQGDILRTLIGKNKTEEAIAHLKKFALDDAEKDQLTIQESKYDSLTKGEISGGISKSEVREQRIQLHQSLLRISNSIKANYKYKQETFGEESSSTTQEKSLTKVFFSVANPHNDHQQKFINELAEHFKTHGISLETLTEWNDSDPLLAISNKLKKCKGCLVLALERMHVSSGITKRGSEQQQSFENSSFTSPWLQIEAALARSYDMPLIILKDKSLKNHGLIHEEKQEWGIARIDQDKFEEIRQYPLKNMISNWVKKVHDAE